MKCSDEKKIEMLAADTLPENEAAMIERHIAHCMMCRAQYEAAQYAGSQSHACQ
jgi:hypothetical protein